MNKTGRHSHASRVILAFLLVLVVCTGVAWGASEGAGGTKGWVTTDTYRVMNFVVLVVLLVFLLRKPLSQALGSRIKGIETQLSELEAKKQAAEAKLAEYNNRLALLDQEAEQIVDGYIRQGQEARERILKEAQNAAEKLEEHARRNIEHEFEQAKTELRNEIFEKALAQAETLVTAKITPDDQEKLVDDYLEKVVA